MMPDLDDETHNGGFRWDWRVGPQTVISGLNLLVMLGGLIYVLASVQIDVRIAREQVGDLKKDVNTLANSQQQQAIDGAQVKAKVDMILPMVEKLNDLVSQQHRRDGGG